MAQPNRAATRRTSSTASVPNGGEGANMSRMKNLLGDFYGVSNEDKQDSAEAKDNIKNIDSSFFVVDAYVSDKLKKFPYAKLLDEEEELRLSIVTLNESMHELVYENYSKFIGATDTMRNMKEKLVNMESQVSGLESKMEAISSATKRMSERNAAKRTEVARLDRLANVVTNLSSLFELPNKLRTVTNLEELQPLVKLFKSAKPFLNKHKDVPSFANIVLTSDKVSEEIRTRLLKSLEKQTEKQSATAFNATLSILLDLDESPEELSPLFFAWHWEAIQRFGISQETMVELNFEQGVQRVKTTMLEPLKSALSKGDACFTDSLEARKTLAREGIRLALDRVRARFDAEPSTFGREAKMEELLLALGLAIREFSHFDSCFVGLLKLSDRTQELGERVLRRQVTLTLSELRARAEVLVVKLNETDNLSESRGVMEDVVNALIADTLLAQTHVANLVKQSTAFVSSEITSTFEDLFRAFMQEYVEWLGDRFLVFDGPSANAITALLHALVARQLASRVNEFDVLDVKSAAKSLKAAGDAALKAFCSAQGIRAARELFSPGAADVQTKPSKISNGVIQLLNSTLELSAVLKHVGIPVKSTVHRSSTQAISSLNAAKETNALGQNLQRLFAEKLVVFDRVEFDGPSIFAATFRVAIKTWFEYIREEVLSRHAFHQVQADAAFVRRFAALLTGEHAPGVIKLLAEVVSSAKERCADPSTLEPAIMDNLYNARKDEVMVNLLV